MKKTHFLFSLLLLFTLIVSSCATPTPEATKENLATSIPKVLSQDDIAKLWKQYEGKGITIDFLSEDTPPTAVIIKHVKEFEDLTGIKVNITQTNLADVTTKTLLDFTANAGEITVIYADPFQILAPMYGHFVDLRKYINDPTLPPLPNGFDDFVEQLRIVESYMIDKDVIRTIPFDTGTELLAYRTDIFENASYKQMFMNDKGYDWTPGPNITWEQYAEIAEWINQKIKDGVITEVKYGTGHQAKQYDSLMCDFVGVLRAYGANFFKNPEFATWGTSTPGAASLNTPEGIAAAKMYKRILDAADPGSLGWDWNGVAEAYAAGDLAMHPQWHEYASMYEDPTLSKVVGKTAWVRLPKGPAGYHNNNFGGTGVGINSYAPVENQRAAWLFILWATSPEFQKNTIQEGNSPTRISVYNDPEVQTWITEKKTPLLGTLNALLESWQPENIGLAQGKIVTWIQVDEAIFTNLSQMLANQKSPEQAMKDADEQINKINNWPPPSGQ
jgi:multiple sugar transport system substrate-binding protein